MANRIFNRSSFEGFMGARKVFNESQVGKLVQAVIVGNGNLITVKDIKGQPVIKDGQPLQKMIYNVDKNSSLALTNPRLREKAVKAIALEGESKFQEASDLYNEMLNDMQISFDVWANSSRRFSNGQVIQGILEKVTTEKGSLLKLTNVSAVQAEQATGAAVKSLDDLLSFGEEPAATGEPGTADNAAAILAGTK
jgi:hypothetical protein